MTKVWTFCIAASLIAMEVFAQRGDTTTLSHPLQINTKSDGIANRYVVMVTSAADVDPVVGMVSTQLGGIVYSTWRDAVYGFSVQASESAMAQLANDVRVIEIAQDDRPVYAGCPQIEKYPSVCADGSIPWQLDRLDGVADGQYYYCYTGAGSKIYIVDTGIKSDHPEFGGRVLDGMSYVPGEPSTVDVDSHGTVAASVAAGSGAGAAKSAILISVRVDRIHNQATLSTWIDAVNWIDRDIHCVSPNRATPGCVGNLGWMHPIVYFAATFQHDNTFETAVRKLIADGAVVVGPAGNSANNACSNGLSNVAGAIIAGAVQRSGSGLTLWPSSSYGGCVTLLAPGAAVGVGYISGYDCNPGWNGTSWSAALTAGVAAIFAQRGGGDVRTLMLQSASSGTVTGDLHGSPNLILQSVADCYYIPENCAPMMCPPYCPVSQ